jgi:hypothetical protein
MRRRLLLVLGSVGLLVLLSGCGQLLANLWNIGEAIDSKERIELFQEELNGDRANIGDHLHPDASLWNDPQTWNSVFDPDVTFTFENVTATGESDGVEDIFTATVSTSQPSTDPLEGATVEFGMTVVPSENDSDFIRSLTISGHSLGSNFEDPHVFMDPDGNS